MALRVDIGYGVGRLWPKAVHMCLQCLVKCKTLYTESQPSPGALPSNQSPSGALGRQSSAAAHRATNPRSLSPLRFAENKEACTQARTRWFDSKQSQVAQSIARVHKRPPFVHDGVLSPEALSGPSFHHSVMVLCCCFGLSVAVELVVVVCRQSGESLRRSYLV